MKIGELAKQAGCPVETIRYYEREGLLLSPQRTESNYRTYTETHLDRLLFIRNCRSLDMSHEEIRLLLAWRDNPAQHCGDVNELVDEHIRHVSNRIQSLLALEAQLKTLRQRCMPGPEQDNCKILDNLSTSSVPNANVVEVDSHVAAVRHPPTSR